MRFGVKRFFQTPIAHITPSSKLVVNLTPIRTVLQCRDYLAVFSVVFRESPERRVLLFRVDRRFIDRMTFAFAAGSSFARPTIVGRRVDTCFPPETELENVQFGNLSGVTHGPADVPISTRFRFVRMARVSSPA